MSLTHRYQPFVKHSTKFCKSFDTLFPYVCNRVKRILSISLSLLLVASSLSLTFTTHFCGGHAVKSEIALGHSDLKCGMGMGDHKLPSDDTSIHAKACCENEYVSIQIDNEFNPTMEKSTPNIHFLMAFAHSYATVAFSDRTYSITSDTSPPIFDQDFRVLYQNFLI